MNWLPLHPTFDSLKRQVAVARREAFHEAKADGPWVRNRGTFLSTIAGSAQEWPHPAADCHEWDGTKRELDEVIADLLANHPKIDALYVEGGFDAADTFDDLYKYDNYLPQASWWQVKVWERPGRETV